MKSWIKRCHSSILHEQVVSYSKSSSWSRLRPSVTVPTLAIYPSPHTGAFCPFITLMVAFPWSFPLKAASLQARDYIYYIDLSFSKTTWDLINTLLTSLSYSRKQFNKSSILLISYIDLCFSFTCTIFSYQYICSSSAQVLSGSRIDLGGFIDPSPQKIWTKICRVWVYMFFFFWKKIVRWNFHWTCFNF